MTYDEYIALTYVTAYATAGTDPIGINRSASLSVDISKFKISDLA